MGITGSILEEHSMGCDFVQIDPFKYVTIASACMAIYRAKFLTEEHMILTKDSQGLQKWAKTRVNGGIEEVCIRPDTWIQTNEVSVEDRRFISSPLAKIPACGYTPSAKCSIESLQWILWTEEHLRREGNAITIRHAHSPGGEHKVKRPDGKGYYLLDGYYKDRQTGQEYCWEFHGCLWHGCISCFDSTTNTLVLDEVRDEDLRSTPLHPITKQPMSQLYHLTQQKRKILEELGFKYYEIWEHEFKRQMYENCEMRTFINKLSLSQRLNVRDAFFGGRTNASRLYVKTNPNEKIHYIDVTSLYPTVNKYDPYPIGHPQIILSDFQAIQKYFGFAKIQILPPRGLYHPVLPYRCHGKLFFPLCRTCAENETQTSCVCTDDQRMLTGTWVTVEIEKAIEKGYVVKRIFEVYHFKEWKQGLFANYVNTFLKVKQEASGWPASMHNATSADKLTYLKKFEEHENVQLDFDKIKKNPGLRSVAKTCLNAFWGKFAQRQNLPQSVFINSERGFYHVMTDRRKKLRDVQVINKDVAMITYDYHDLCQPDNESLNIFIAAFTTANARLRLYGILEKLGDKVCYYDTDSCIYIQPPGEYKIPLGNHLGDMTTELGCADVNCQDNNCAKEHYICEFVSCGPKNYAYLTDTGHIKCKVRGFTLNYINSQVINFETMKQMILSSQDMNKVAVTNPMKITRNKLEQKIYNRKETKVYKCVYTKRRIVEDYNTLPYGY